MKPLCFIVVCKGRLEHLRQTLPLMVGQPDTACVVVDYDCPQGTADWVAAQFPQVDLVRVVNQPGFNWCHARNLGARAPAAQAPWLCFIDADILLRADFSAVVVPQLAAGYFYRPAPVTVDSWGTCICTREDYAAIGGFDENFDGWGGQDNDFYLRLWQVRGRRPGSFPAELLAAIRHDDTQRFTFHDVKSRQQSLQIAALYTQAKLDLMRLTAFAEPTAQTCVQLYQSAKETVAKAAPEADKLVLNIRLPRGGDTPRIEGWDMERSFAVTLSATAMNPGAQA